MPASCLALARFAPFRHAPLAVVLVACVSGAAAAQLVFEPAVTTPLVDTVIGHTLGDLDGDGDADLVIGKFSGAPEIRFSDGAGLFGPPVVVDQPGLASRTVALADLDGDAALDLIVGSLAPPTGMLWVLKGVGDGSFGPPAPYPLGGSTVFSNLAIETGDADGDGDLDVAATTGPVFSAMEYSEVRLLLNDGTGALSTALLAPSLAPEFLRRAFPVDANGDNLPDLVVTTAVIVDFSLVPRLHVLTGTLGGGFVTSQYLPDVAAVKLADLDADGDADLLTTIVGGGLVQIRPGNGSGVYPPGSITPTGFSGPFVDFADFDGDGMLDLVATSNSPITTVQVHLGEGLGGFPGPILPFSIPLSGVTQPRAADVDGDGRQDLALLLDNSSVFPKLGVARNRTYTNAEPLLDLGFALAGGKGFPIQVAEGSFGAGDPFSFKLYGAPAAGATYHVVGVTQLLAPFKGGVLVPAPDLITGPWIATAAGTVTLAGPWPGGAPSGLVLTLQFWFADPGGAAGFAASSAVQVTL